MSKPQGFLREMKETLEKIDSVLHTIEPDAGDTADLNEVKIRSESIRDWAIKMKSSIQG